MSDIVTIGAAALYRGDCRDVLAGIAPAKVVVTDPPYKLTTGGRARGQKTMSGIFAADNYANDGKLVLTPLEWGEVMALLHGWLAADADCYVMANDKNLRAALNAADAAGFGFHNMLVWDKITATANRWYMKNVEFALYLWKGRARVINDAGSKQLMRCPQIDETTHPTEKPVALMAHYIKNSSNPGDVVLDPFMGSGTTGVAALRTGRGFIGCELDPKFFDMAVARMESALDQPGLFGNAA